MQHFNDKYDRLVKDNALQLDCRIYGHAPVQAEGTIATRRFYFRARHDEWTFSVALSPNVDPIDVQLPHQGFFREATYGKPRDEAASFMSHDDAEMFIRRCAQEFLDSQTK